MTARSGWGCVETVLSIIMLSDLVTSQDRMVQFEGGENIKGY